MTQGPPPGPEERSPLLVRAQPLATVFVWAVVLVLVLYFFSAVALILEGILAAACLAATMRPVVAHLWGSRGLRAVVAGAIPILIAAGLIALCTWLIARDLPQYQDEFPKLANRVNSMAEEIQKRLGVGGPQGWRAGPESWISSILGELGAVLTGGFHLLEHLALWLAFVFIGEIFLLLDPPGFLTNPVIAFLPPHRARQVRKALDELDAQLRWWMIGTLIIALAVGLLSWGVYKLVGVPLAEPLAMLAGAAEIMPDVGPLLMWVPAVVLAATVGVWPAVWLTAAYVGIHIVEAYVLAPYIFRRSVKLPPAVTLFSIIFWWKVLGLPGLLLAIPLDLTVWTFARNLLERHRAPPAKAEG